MYFKQEYKITYDVYRAGGFKAGGSEVDEGW